MCEPGSGLVSVGLGQERTVQVHLKKECRTPTCCVYYVRYCGQRVGAIHPLSSSVARGQSPGRAQDVILVCGPTATHQPLEWSGRHEPAPSPKCTRRHLWDSRSSPCTPEPSNRRRRHDREVGEGTGRGQGGRGAARRRLGSGVRGLGEGEGRGSTCDRQGGAHCVAEA